jgi:hypothetical protein
MQTERMIGDVHYSEFGIFVVAGVLLILMMDNAISIGYKMAMVKK